MQSHQLQKSKVVNRRVGRGGKRGSYSGKGIKGQKSRAGRRVRPQIRDVIKKIHKRRGYSFKSHYVKPAVVSFGSIAQHFDDGARVTAKMLVKAGLVHMRKGSVPVIKVLGGEASKKKFSFSKEIVVSGSVKAKQNSHVE